MTKPPPTPIESFSERSETPRTDAFIDTLPIIPMTDPMTAARAMREHMIAWAEFARELEREISRKVWPH